MARRRRSNEEVRVAKGFTLYGVQARDMHTAIHNVFLFTHRKAAERVLEYIDKTNELPGWLGHPKASEVYVDVREVNFRGENPLPVYSRGGEEYTVEIINAGTVVPDFYF